MIQAVEFEIKSKYGAWHNNCPEIIRKSLIMNFSKWANIIKIILLKAVEELERRINEKNGVTSADNFSTSIYTSLKFIVLEQVDGLVDEAVSYTKKQVNELSTLIAEKTSVILASLVYILILVGMIFLTFIFLTIAFSLYLGTILGNNYFGFLITAGLTLLITLMIYYKGHSSISKGIKNHLTKLV
jgi:hypothetical protein